MLHLLALGGIIGVAVGYMFKQNSSSPDWDVREPGSREQQQQQPGPVLPAALLDNPAQLDGGSTQSRSRFSHSSVRF